MRQIGFGFLKDYKKEFGGSLLSGKRKGARPLSTAKPIHLVLKSTGSSFFSPGNRSIEKLIRDQANKYQIKVYELSLNWSHVHLLMKLPSREKYNAFIRTATALIVAFVSKKKCTALSGLFDLRPFTRVLSWGRDLKNVFDYHELNDQEARGLVLRHKPASEKRKKARG